MNPVREAKRAVGLFRKAIAERTAERNVRRTLAARPSPQPGSYRIAVYFPDDAVNMYQVRQWYRPLAALAERWPVVVLARTATGAEAILEDGVLPVAYVPSVADLERFAATQGVRVVLYVNQNMRNFQMFRYPRMWHVFVNHGESDKMYMTTNQFKAYDYALVAGQAARERLSRALWGYDVAQRTIEIGRPQADHFAGTVPFAPDGRQVVLYAPTWEGDRPAAHYGSIRSHGETLVRALLETGRHRVIYRPHPRSGVADPEYAAAHRRIVEMIRAANARDQIAQHVHDDGPEIGWQLAAADVAIVDISAMVYDRLATGKPLLICRPVDPAAEIDEGGYLSHCEWLDAPRAGAVVAETERVRLDPEAADRLAHWARHYFGDTAAGAATEKFEAAMERLMREWDEWHARE